MGSVSLANLSSASLTTLEWVVKLFLNPLIFEPFVRAFFTISARRLEPADRSRVAYPWTSHERSSPEVRVA